MRTAPVVPDHLPTVSVAGAARRIGVPSHPTHTVGSTTVTAPGRDDIPHRLDDHLFAFLGAEYAGRRRRNDVSPPRWVAAAVGSFVLPLVVVGAVGAVSVASMWGLVSALMEHMGR